MAALQARAITVATVGDSMADALYLGLKGQPELLRKSGIKLVRWSRPVIGLTRVDYFDYTSWLRDTTDLGSVDFCVVELGANDLQSIAAGDEKQNAKKWIAVGTDAWQQVYTSRVQALIRTLKPQRCASVIWLLQPPYQKNKYLGQYHVMINAAQFAGAGSSGVTAFEIDAGPDDYGPDGIHPNTDFCLKLARAVAALLAAGHGANCASCHSSPALATERQFNFAPLIPHLR
jgi:lysophospholipase L1-like esterase